MAEARHILDIFGILEIGLFLSLLFFVVLLLLPLFALSLIGALLHRLAFGPL